MYSTLMYYFSFGVKPINDNDVNNAPFKTFQTNLNTCTLNKSSVEGKTTSADSASSKVDWQEEPTNKVAPKRLPWT